MPEPFSLAGRAWLPVASKTGQRRLVRLCEISQPDVARLDTGRPDTDTALAEFLIGLLAVTIGPNNKSEWLDLYRSPPTPEHLKAAFAPFAEALVLDGDGPRFFQDLDELSGNETPVEALFIDAPADHFMLDRRYQILSRTGAAIALLTLQTMAPSGGAGHRTSLRGGGPLTTFVVPRAQPNLWQFLWANVPDGLKASADAAALIFPWLGPTRTSNPKEKGEITTPAHVNAAQAFFGMPRRIRLTFEDNNERRLCDLLGELAEPDDRIVRTYVTRPWGGNYPSNTWRHPLTPYYKQKKADTEMLPLHLKSARVGYRHWLGLVSATDDGLTNAAVAVAHFRKDRARSIREEKDHVRLKAAGYALDNMKPLEFAEALLPLFAADEKTNTELDKHARGMIDAADVAAWQLSGAIRLALYGEKAKVDSGSTVLSSVASEFWSETEEPFFARLEALSNVVLNAIKADSLADGRADITATHAPLWLRVLKRTALGIFDATAPIGDSDPERLADVINGRKQLSLMFKGHGKNGRALFTALGLALPSPTSGGGADKPRNHEIRSAKP